MSKEDDRVTSPPEKLYSIGPDLAGVVDYRGFAFEIWGGRVEGDIFVSVGKFGPPGTVEKEGQVLFDLPSVVNGGGKHPHTSQSLYDLRETIINYGRKTLSPNEKIIEKPLRVELVSLSGNRLRLTYRRGLLIDIDAESADRKRQIHLGLFSSPGSQTTFSGIINSFYRLAEAIQEDNRLPRFYSDRS